MKTPCCIQVAFGTVRMLKLEGGQALGLFAAGCAPGGGASNIYTYILGGDVSLSVTMTLVSTVASFGEFIFPIMPSQALQCSLECPSLPKFSRSCSVLAQVWNFFAIW